MKVILLKSAQKELDKLPNETALRIGAKIHLLKDNPYGLGSEKLGGDKGYRIRVGNYRVVYTIDKQKKIIFIVKIGHRRDVYRATL